MFPVTRVGTMLRQYGTRVSKSALRKHIFINRVLDAAISVAAVLEYLTREVIELAGNFTKKEKKSRITPRHLWFGIFNDAELSEVSAIASFYLNKKLYQRVTITYAGVVPHIHKKLLPKKKEKSSKASLSESTAQTV